MPVSTFPNDPLWPRAGSWFVPGAPPAPDGTDLAIIGVPAHLTSISPTGAHATPGEIREALMRYSPYSARIGVDLTGLRAVDLGDIDEPDGPDGEARVRFVLAGTRDRQRLIIALGGDNSITYPVMLGAAGDRVSEWGLITVDAHHDLREGTSNGSPVRRLVEAGVPGERIVQIGIADFANSEAYAARARELGITVIPRSELRHHALTDVVARALSIAGAGGREVYVDLDADVCDRATVPGCPASAPGGISADELRELAFLVASDPRVKAIDITEVDATADASDGRTVRLAALLVLEAAAGLAARPAAG